MFLFCPSRSINAVFCSQLTSSKTSKSKASESRKNKAKKVDKKKKVKAKKQNKAGFKRSVGEKGLKGPNVAKDVVYGEYNISKLPKEAYPDMAKVNLGKHSYTLSREGSAVEVLLQKEAYFVKKVGGSGTGPTGQVSWAKHEGPVKAFEVAKERAGYSRWDHEERV